MTRRVLLIAYHFPPVHGSSGLQRTLGFTRHLSEYGWEPVILSVHSRAYPQTSAHQMADIPEGLIVRRTLALDSARHLAFKGIYPGLLAVPDRWWSWWLSAVPAGLRLIRQWQPAIIWSTAPIATAHWIALTLHRLSGLPWIADIRDLLTEPNEPEHPAAWKATRWIERRTLASSTRTVVVSPGQRAAYRRQFPALEPSRIQVIPNGFEEAPFREAEQRPPPNRPRDRLLLLHSGVLYPDGRNPEALLQALAQLIEQGRLGKEELAIRLRAPGFEERYGPRIQELDLSATVKLMPALDYREGLAEMLAADGLLLLQGAGTSTAIPAKLYEYFRARRPILALTEPEGATATALREAGFTRIAPLESADAIASAFEAFIQDLRHNQGHSLSHKAASRYSRWHCCAQLAALFDEAVS